MARDDNPEHCSGCGKSEFEVGPLAKCRSFVRLCEECTKDAFDQFQPFFTPSDRLVRFLGRVLKR